MIYKQEAVIIKLNDFAEADKLAILIGKDKGYIKAIAKGARKPTSKKTAFIDLGVIAKFHLAEGRTFNIITEILPIFLPEKLKTSLEKSALIYYIFELTEKFFRHTEQGNEIYEDLVFTLKTVEKKEDSEAILKTAIIFQIKLLFITGFLRNIIRTKKPGKKEARNYKIIKYCTENDFAQALKLKLDKNDIKYLFNDLFNQIIEILEQEPKSYKFLLANFNKYFKN